MMQAKAGAKAFAFLLGGLAAFIAAGVGAGLAQDGPEQQEPEDQVREHAIVVLEQAGDSGFHGVAFLRGAQEETQALIVLEPPDGLLPFVPPTDGDIGDAVLLAGTCALPSDMVHRIGRPERLLPEDLPGAHDAHVARGIMPIALNELLDGEYALAVLQDIDDAAEPKVTPLPPETPPGVTPIPDVTPEPIAPAEQMIALVCGQLTPEARLGEAPRALDLPDAPPPTPPGLTPGPPQPPID